jgi:hypothetical protein
METADWRDFRDRGKDIRNNRLKRHRKYIYLFCQQYGLTYFTIQDWQIRVSDGNTVVDFFPKAKKYHNITTQKRGSYHYLGSFIKSVFNLEK